MRVVVPAYGSIAALVVVVVACVVTGAGSFTTVVQLEQTIGAKIAARMTMDLVFIRMVGIRCERVRQHLTAVCGRAFEVF